MLQDVVHGLLFLTDRDPDWRNVNITTVAWKPKSKIRSASSMTCMSAVQQLYGDLKLLTPILYEDTGINPGKPNMYSKPSEFSKMNTISRWQAENGSMI